MNISIVPALALALLMLAGCEKQAETGSLATPDTAPLVADRAGDIAGDKTQTADLMRRSFEKGTFDDALTMAMQDSALAAEVVAVIRANPQYAGLLKEKSATAPQTALSSTAKTPTRSRTTQSSTPRSSTSRDPLDKAENTMNKANEKLDQAARVRTQIEEARRKAEGILKPR